MIIRDPDTKNYTGIACDTCATSAPDILEIQKGHGLMRMGWQCLGGKHICPECPHDAVVPHHNAPLTR